MAQVSIATGLLKVKHNCLKELNNYCKNTIMDQEEKKRYSNEELKEFEQLIIAKLDQACVELDHIKETLTRRNDSGTDFTTGASKILEDGSDSLEKENLNQLAARQQKFISQLKNALARIKNGTYGICIDSGKLIQKERLMAVPHTMHSIEAKLGKKS